MPAWDGPGWFRPNLISSKLAHQAIWLATASTSMTAGLLQLREAGIGTDRSAAQRWTLLNRRALNHTISSAWFYLDAMQNRSGRLPSQGAHCRGCTHSYVCDESQAGVAAASGVLLFESTAQEPTVSFRHFEPLAHVDGSVHRKRPTDPDCLLVGPRARLSSLQRLVDLDQL
jgi:hypothetical protein